MEPTSLSRTLRNMEERGFIYRESSNTDKRKSIVFLTPLGVQKRKVARDVVLEFNEKLYKELPKTKVKAFFEVMEKVDTVLTGLLDDKKSSTIMNVDNQTGSIN